MRVPLFVGQGRIEWGEKPVPVPGPGQLLLRVGANSLCGSERGQWQYGSSVTPGHDAAGTVVAAGPQTTTPPGTHGVVFLMDFCGACRSCRLGFTNQCAHKRADMGFNRDGGYAPYELVSESVFFAVDAGLSPGEATLLLDVMGTGGHAISRAQMVRPDIQSLLICGAGPIGLGLLVMAKLRLGDIPVLVSDVSPFRLQMAASLGGLPISLRDNHDAPISLREGLPRHGFGEVDAAIDSSGKSVARHEAIELLAARGVLVCVGHGEGLHFEVSRHLIAPERAVLGSEYFRFDELPANLRLLREHRKYLGQIITHHFGGHEIARAFELFFAGQTGKVIVQP
ncbi:MAG: hypothetical protein JWN98_1465 [Abditibacteriota bacterium]|nr:hypothetical protein [Abditibacteriota bacterium]